MDKDFFIDHIENCDYCSTIQDNNKIPQDQRDELINEHTLDAYTSLIDRVYDEEIDRLLKLNV